MAIDERNGMSLQWVQEDIEDSLWQVRIALESFADEPSEGESLRVCADTLHGVHGVLEMLEVYGCSLLFDEMEGIIDGLMTGAITRRDDACKVLMQGIVQVPDYLDFIARGNRDNAVVLMPLLNDIRSVRGMPLLSENLLFAPVLDASLPVSERPVALDGDEFVVHMRKLRPYFQRGLVGWYRGDDLPSAFQLLDAVVLHVEKVVGSSPCARLWWVARALVQALRTEGIDHSASLKLLLAQVDRQLKALASRGVEGCQQTPPEDLLKNLLYYVARSSTRSRRIDAVRSTFKLDQLVSPDQATGLSDSPLFGPNLDTFASFSVAVKESLARIQDALDSYSRKEDKNTEELVPLSVMLQKVADTLGLLGLGIPRRSILEQRDVVEELTEAGTVPTNDQLMDIAGVVLGIDATMNVLAEQGLERIIDNAQPDEALDPADSNLTGIEYLQLVTSVIGEIKTDLAVVKDAIAMFLEDPSQRRRLDDVPRRVEQMIGGMRMLYLQPAADLMDRWLCFVDRVLLNSQASPDAGTLEQLADGIESIEYYLESAANARSDAEQRLAGAQERISALPQYMGESTAVPEIQMLLVDGDIQALRVQLEAVDVALEPSDTTTVDFLVDEEQSDAERANGTGGEVGFPLSSYSALEAEEITMFDVSEPDAGVGAALWNTEIFRDQTAGSQPGIADPIGLDDAAIALAQLPSQSDQVTAASDAETLVADASAGEDETVDGDFSAETEVDDYTGFREPPLDVPLPSSVVETLAHAQSLLERMSADDVAVANTKGRQDNFSIDPDLTLSDRLEFREAFLEEAAEILDSFDWVVSNWRDNGNSEPVMAKLLRGLHTLKGGARMVQAGPLSDLSHALESALAAASDTQQPMNGGVLSMVEVVHDRIADMLDCMVAHQPLIPSTDLIAQMQARDWSQTNWSCVKLLDVSIDYGGAPTDNVIDTGFDSGPETLGLTWAEDHAEAASDSEDDVSGLLQAGAEVAAAAAAGFAGAALGGQFGSELPSPEVGDVEGVAAQAMAAKLAEHAEDRRDDVDVDHTSAPELAYVPSFATQAAESLDAPRQSADDGAGQFDVTASPELPADASDTAAEFAAGATFVGDAESSMATAAVGEPSAEQVPLESISDPDSEEVAAALHDSASAEPELSPVSAEEAPLAERAERIQVDAEVLDNLVGFAGEISTSRAQIELQVGAFRQNVDEMNQTVMRLREQLHRLELETESQITYPHERESSEQQRADVDPLELDRFSRMQALSRGLAESVGDLTNIQSMLESLTRESESILAQQARTNTDLQHGLMQTRMLPFDRMVPRFRRIVRQTSRELKKQVRLEIEGDDIRIDRAILNRMVGPLEHIFRNAVDHGIESEAQRIEQGKPAEACISVSISRDGPEMEIRIADDGDGVPLEAVRSRALQRELLVPGVQLPDADLLQFIFEPAFSTSRSVTQISGRGVGLDVVQNEVKQLGGSVRVESPPDSGAVFVIRLPLTLAANQALMVSVRAEERGLPLSNVDAVLRISAEIGSRTGERS